MTTKLEQAARLALAALETCYNVADFPANGKSDQDEAIIALREALAEPKLNEGNSKEIKIPEGFRFARWNEVDGGFYDVQYSNDGDCWVNAEDIE
jgi:hypothetical protein